ncbi:MAG: hypothetical protein U9R72_16930 [Chloroflexota bacterium]|nr:hypothetical protein [Chloroflexota bacterium]
MEIGEVLVQPQHPAHLLPHLGLLGIAQRNVHLDRHRVVCLPDNQLHHLAAAQSVDSREGAPVQVGVKGRQAPPAMRPDDGG